MLKRIISAIIVMAFLFTQCGIGAGTAFAMRSETAAESHAGSAVGQALGVPAKAKAEGDRGNLVTEETLPPSTALIRLRDFVKQHGSVTLLLGDPVSESIYNFDTEGYNNFLPRLMNLIPEIAATEEIERKFVFWRWRKKQFQPGDTVRVTCEHAVKFIRIEHPESASAAAAGAVDLMAEIPKPGRDTKVGEIIDQVIGWVFDEKKATKVYVYVGPVGQQDSGSLGSVFLNKDSAIAAIKDEELLKDILGEKAFDHLRYAHNSAELIGDQLNVRFFVESSAAAAGDNEAIFAERLSAYDEAFAKYEALPQEYHESQPGKVRPVRNAMNWAREQLWLESQKQRVAVEKGKPAFKKGAILCDVMTKRVFAYDPAQALPEDFVAKAEEGLIVELAPLDLSIEVRQKRDELIAQLTDEDAVTRQNALKLLKIMERDSGPLAAPYPVPDIFVHCHTTFSYGPTIEFMAYRAYQLGLGIEDDGGVVGIVDHNTNNGIKFWRQACRILGITSHTSGFEVRVTCTHPEFKDTTTNFPDVIGETYLVIHAVDEEGQIEFLEKIKAACIKRFRKTIDYLNAEILPALGAQFDLDYDRDVHPLLERQDNNPMERHLAEGIARQIIGGYSTVDERIAFMERLLAEISKRTGAEISLSDSEKTEKVMSNPAELLKVLRSNLIVPLRKIEGLAPDRDECPTDRDVIAYAKKMGWKVYYPFLGGGANCCVAEKAENGNRERLIRYYIELGIDGIAFMPDRNTMEEQDFVGDISKETPDEEPNAGMDVNEKVGMPYTSEYSAQKRFLPSAYSMRDVERDKLAAKASTVQGAGISAEKARTRILETIRPENPGVEVEIYEDPWLKGVLEAGGSLEPILMVFVLFSEDEDARPEIMNVSEIPEKLANINVPKDGLVVLIKGVGAAIIAPDQSKVKTLLEFFTEARDIDLALRIVALAEACNIEIPVFGPDDSRVKAIISKSKPFKQPTLPFAKSDDAVKQDIIAAGIPLEARRLALGRSGNLSVRYDKGRLTAVKKSGRETGRLQPADIAVFDNETQQVVGEEGVILSTEFPVHQGVYEALMAKLEPGSLLENAAMAHVHATVTTALGAADKNPAPSVIALTPYKLPHGSNELIEVVAEAHTEKPVVVWGKHGISAVAGTIADAADIAILTEDLSLEALKIVLQEFYKQGIIDISDPEVLGRIIAGEQVDSAGRLGLEITTALHEKVSGNPLAKYTISTADLNAFRQRFRWEKMSEEDAFAAIKAAQEVIRLYFPNLEEGSRELSALSDDEIRELIKRTAQSLDSNDKGNVSFRQNGVNIYIDVVTAAAAGDLSTLLREGGLSPEDAFDELYAFAGKNPGAKVTFSDLGSHGVLILIDEQHKPTIDSGLKLTAHRMGEPDDTIHFSYDLDNNVVMAGAVNKRAPGAAAAGTDRPAYLTEPGADKLEAGIVEKAIETGETLLRGILHAEDLKREIIERSLEILTTTSSTRTAVLVATGEIDHIAGEAYRNSLVGMRDTEAQLSEAGAAGLLRPEPAKGAGTGFAGPRDADAAGDRVEAALRVADLILEEDARISASWQRAVDRDPTNTFAKDRASEGLLGRSSMRSYFDVTQWLEKHYLKYSKEQGSYSSWLEPVSIAMEECGFNPKSPEDAQYIIEQLKTTAERIVKNYEELDDAVDSSKFAAAEHINRGNIFYTDLTDSTVTALGLALLAARINAAHTVVLVSDDTVKDRLKNAFRYGPLSPEDIIPVNGDIGSAIQAAIARLKAINSRLEEANYYSNEMLTDGIRTSIKGVIFTQLPVPDVTDIEHLRQILEQIGISVSGGFDEAEYKAFEAARALAGSV